MASKVKMHDPVFVRYGEGEACVNTHELARGWIIDMTGALSLFDQPTRRLADGRRQNLAIVVAQYAPGKWTGCWGGDPDIPYEEAKIKELTPPQGLEQRRRGR